MKRIVSFLLLTSILQQLIGQTERFDIVTYTPPNDFKKESKQGSVNFTHTNPATGGFCVIGMYASRASSGDADNDFKSEWKELAETPFKAEANPATETQTTPDGWKVITGSAAVKPDGIECYVILTVTSGFEKTLSVLTLLNDTSYTTKVAAMFESMELDKPVTSTVNNANASLVSTEARAGRFGEMNYTAPAGWSHQIYQDGVVFKPLNLPADEHLAMQIMEPLNFSGSLEQALAQSYNEAATMYEATLMYEVSGGNYTKTELKKSFKGWEYLRGKGGVEVENGTPYKTEMGLELFVIRINNRVERVAILKSRKNCNLSRYYPTDRMEYQKAVDNFLFSLQFDDFNEPGLKPGTLNGSDIVGIWRGISMSAGVPTTGASLGLGYKVYSPIFFSNGQAFFGTTFPIEGLDGFDSRIPSEVNRRDWGTYTFSNGRGVLKMLYGDIPLRMENNKLIITTNQTDHAFSLINPVDGATFDGTYAFSETNGKVPAITFTADGRFTDNGAIKILCHEFIDCINPGLLPGSGTYKVKDYSVLFNYTDGRKIKIAFIGTGYERSDPSPATLRMSFDDNLMTRQ